jgi:hypothetical protein
MITITCVDASLAAMMRSVSVAPALSASVRRPSTVRASPPPQHHTRHSAAPARSVSLRLPGTKRLARPPQQGARQSVALAPSCQSAAPARSASVCRPSSERVSPPPLHRTCHSGCTPPHRHRACHSAAPAHVRARLRRRRSGTVRVSLPLPPRHCGHQSVAPAPCASLRPRPPRAAVRVDRARTCPSALLLRHPGPALRVSHWHGKLPCTTPGMPEPERSVTESCPRMMPDPRFRPAALAPCMPFRATVGHGAGISSVTAAWSAVIDCSSTGTVCSCSLTIPGVYRRL